MRLPGPRHLLLLAGIAGALLAGITGFWWLTHRSANIAFLRRREPAAWVIYPKPLEGWGHPDVEINTVFRRTFTLAVPPAKGALYLCAFKHTVVEVNGARALPFGSNRNWKRPVGFDISRLLHQGTNKISVTVFNDSGPPALWLALDAGAFAMYTGPDWEASLEGAAWRAAQPASEPVPFARGNGLYGGEDAARSLAHQWLALLLFAAISSGAVLGGARWLKSRHARQGSGGPLDLSRFAPKAVAALALLWVALFVNNLPQLSNLIGFDVQAHLDYIQYIKTHHALPLANDGWEMCQPPLYYLLGALLTAPFASVAGDASIQLLRLFGMLVGIAHFVLIFLCLRLLFPKQPGKQLVGLVLAGFVPEQLYLAHYVTNESLAAMLVTASLYFCLRLLGSDEASQHLSAATGLCLGAALLTKVTALLAVPFVAGAIAGWLLIKHARDTRAWTRTLGTCLLAAFLVSFWHYARVWMHFGRPIVQDWDAVSGFAWWTDNGFQTGAYFKRFGECLAHPFYSVFNGFADGIYSTLWGDSLYGGSATLAMRPPWNYELMAAGALLSLLPAALILAGAVSFLVKFLRQPGPLRFLLLGLTFTTFAALVYMSLKLPFYCNVKAFYGLITLLPLCVFGAAGWELLGRTAALRAALCVGLGIWAANAFASFWIRGGATVTHTTRGLYYGQDGRMDDAAREFSEALRLDPHSVPARRGAATLFLVQQQYADARAQIGQALQDAPDDPESLLRLATILAAQGDPDGAVQRAQRAVTLAPDLIGARRNLCVWLARLERNREAAEAGREGLRVEPLDSDLQMAVGCALMAETNFTEAARYFGHACDLTRRQSPLPLANLASALGETGRFDEAADAAGRALQLAQAAGDKGLAVRAQKLLNASRAHAAYHELAPVAP